MKKIEKLKVNISAEQSRQSRHVFIGPMEPVFPSAGNPQGRQIAYNTTVTEYRTKTIFFPDDPRTYVITDYAESTLSAVGTYGGGRF